MHAALKLWRTCGPAAAGVSSSKAEQWSGPPSLRCLQQDYTTKLRNKTALELRTLGACMRQAEDRAVPASVDWIGCLRLSSVMLGPKQVHKVLEDSSFVWRSMYAAHLRAWLRLFPPSQLLVVDPAALLGPSTHAAGLRHLARFAGLSTEPALIRDQLLETPSPGARQLGEAAGVHENQRRYILGSRGPPAEVVRNLHSWLRPHNCDLAGLLLRRGLAAVESATGGGTDSSHGGAPAGLLPWLVHELEGNRGWARAEGAGGSVCAGVVNVDEWFVAA